MDNSLNSLRAKEPPKELPKQQPAEGTTDNSTIVIEEMQKTIDKLNEKLGSLSDEFNRNNFSTSQDFQKYSRFNTRMKIPHYVTAPSVCEVGEMIEMGGKAYICSAVNTFTIIGTQS